MQPLAAVTVAATLAATACTTLGPMPTTTGVSAVPVGRPGVEVQAGLVPAAYLSDAAHEGEPTNASASQLSALVEAGRRGLVVGARRWGEAGDSPIEPFAGLRRRLSPRIAVAGLGFGTRARGAQAGASYEAVRAGGELIVDAELIPFAPGYGIHVHGGVSATYLDASGTYCVDSVGNATDCEDTTRRVDGAAQGIYGAATAGVSLDLARRDAGFVHLVRLAFEASLTGLPRIRDGVQQPSDDVARAFGLTLTLGLGEP